MTVQGFFDGTGRPRVEAVVVLPHLRTRGLVEFMVDTGADTTVLSRSDAESIGAKIDGLDDPHDVGGIGGTMRMYSVPAAVCLSDGSNERSFDIPIGIPDKIKDSAGYAEMPSLLGRDVINRSVMIYDSLRRKLEFVFPLQFSETPFPT
ncbi:MAG: retropepsin-like aspartic protease [Spirochaetaceae bacterium]|nr:retropepsin-like aspartic protease [Spirochaetaceae bacterium]